MLSGVAECSTAAACRYVRDCEAPRRRRLHGHAGDGLQGRPARDALSHFRKVAAATNLPWMLYNNPVGYTVDMSRATQMGELADIQ